MKYGFVLPGNDAQTSAELAHEAEESGWDGIFVPDFVWGIDPWVTLTAIAMKTERLRFGPMITPVSRRRPWTLAGETATLDQLSNGRLILSVGLGATDTGFANFGEETDRKTRAELLDEGLEILTGLWRGQPFNYSGTHYQVRETTFMTPSPPVQSPRIPIWVVGGWPSRKSMQRVIRYDGLLPNLLTTDGPTGEIGADDVRAMKTYIDEHRTETTPFDIVLEGETPGAEPSRAGGQIQPLAEAGMTWWLETKWTAPNDLDSLRSRIHQGPPSAG